MSTNKNVKKNVKSAGSTDAGSAIVRLAFIGLFIAAAASIGSQDDIGWFDIISFIVTAGLACVVGASFSPQKDKALSLFILMCLIAFSSLGAAGILSQPSPEWYDGIAFILMGLLTVVALWSSFKTTVETDATKQRDEYYDPWPEGVGGRVEWPKLDVGKLEFKPYRIHGGKEVQAAQVGYEDAPAVHMTTDGEKLFIPGDWLVIDGQGLHWLFSAAHFSRACLM